MKWLVCLLSIYLLTLSGFTCKAESDCCDDELTEQTSTGHHDDDHQAHSACVPFLACGACNSILPAYHSLDLSLKGETRITVPFHYLDATWTNAPHAIWQPPRLI